MKKMLILLIGVLLVACSHTNDRVDGEVILENNDLVELKGTVMEIYENSILIETEDGDPYVVHLTEAIAVDDFVVGKLVTIGFSGQVMESYPMQINAIKIISKDED